jgi:F0F1-type ATP synthase membrane subunit a
MAGNTAGQKKESFRKNIINQKGILMYPLYTTIFLFICFVNVFLLPGSSTAVPFKDTEFLLFYGNDVRGETEPCG